MMSDYALRPMTDQDLDSWWDAEKNDWKDSWYPPDYFEHIDVMKARLHAYPDGCWVLETYGVVKAYGFSHPWIKKHIVGLNELDEYYDHMRGSTRNISFDCYYIHDVCVKPGCRGCDLGTDIVMKLLAVGHNAGFDCFKLVSVMDSHVFWMKFGFEVIAETTYGGKPAKIMEYNACQI